MIVFALLHRVSELVSEQLSSGRGRRLILAIAHNDMPAHGIGIGANCRRRKACLSVGMHPDCAEVMAEALLHERSPDGIKRLTRRAQDVPHDGRRRISFRTVGGAL
jgi:hypothetical protein